MREMRLVAIPEYHAMAAPAVCLHFRPLGSCCGHQYFQEYLFGHLAATSKLEQPALTHKTTMHPSAL